MNIFETVPIPKVKRNSFNLSHERKFTMEMGKLVPILCQPVVPGDTFKVNTEAMIRFAPMISPIMHRVDTYIHYFFVPNRLVWKNFREFITGGEDGTAEPALPYVNNVSWTQLSQGDDKSAFFGTSSLWDYMGLPTDADLPRDGENENIKVSLLPFKAYQLIYNEYYRDQNLEDPVPLYEDMDGRHITAQLQYLLKIRHRAWKKDYFTGALPFPQRGEDVMLPLHGDAPVIINGTELSGTGGWSFSSHTNVGTSPGIFTTSNSMASESPGPRVVSAGVYNDNGVGRLSNYSDKGGTQPIVNIQGSNQWFLNGLTPLTGNADLTAVTAATINELRRSIALQTFLERSARGGNRYIEYLLAHFGVKSSDARLQRPEYLGGGVMPVVISEILQNSASSEISPQGNMSGHGIAVGKSHKFKAYFEEHGYVIGIMSVIPRATYQQGIPRDFLKMDRFDWYIPAFAHLGEQEIYNAEIYAKGSDPHGLFGYTPRYSEYKYIPGSVHGDFRNNMNFWHLGRIFANMPTLSKEFMEVDETKDGLSRIFAAEFDPSSGEERVYQHLWCYVYNNVKALRPMPIFGVPKIQ